MFFAKMKRVVLLGLFNQKSEDIRRYAKMKPITYMWHLKYIFLTISYTIPPMFYFLYGFPYGLSYYYEALFESNAYQDAVSIFIYILMSL